jgi:hypothetical protein
LSCWRNIKRHSESTFSPKKYQAFDESCKDQLAVEDCNSTLGGIEMGVELKWKWKWNADIGVSLYLVPERYSIGMR